MIAGTPPPIPRTCPAGISGRRSQDVLVGGDDGHACRVCHYWCGRTDRFDNLRCHTPLSVEDRLAPVHPRDSSMIGGPAARPGPSRRFQVEPDRDLGRLPLAATIRLHRHHNGEDGFGNDFTWPAKMPPSRRETSSSSSRRARCGSTIYMISENPVSRHASRSRGICAKRIPTPLRLYA
jgi:hypothetical protein